jgi:hypothetical protein
LGVPPTAPGVVTESVATETLGFGLGSVMLELVQLPENVTLPVEVHDVQLGEPVTPLTVVTSQVWVSSVSLVLFFELVQPFVVVAYL